MAAPEPLAALAVNQVVLNSMRFMLEAAGIESEGACGGGGIPVVENPDGTLDGLEAVIDKDFAAALLAHDSTPTCSWCSTGVEKVAINFNRPDQQWLDHITAADARRLLQEGQFPAGSMGPKIEAIISFLEPGGDRRAIITNPPNLGRALAGATGTHIVPAV